MGFDIIKKYSAELTNTEMYLLADMVNTCFYKKTVPNRLVEELFFSDPKVCNFIVQMDGENAGLFQAKDLPQIESVYFASASVFPEYRRNDIHKLLIDHRIDYYRKQGRKYSGAMSMNPAVIGTLVGKGFYLPMGENPEFLQKAKDILMEIEGNDMGMRGDFVIPHQNIKRFPKLVDIEEPNDACIENFIAAHMDIKKGDRLFLIRKI